MSILPIVHHWDVVLVSEVVTFIAPKGKKEWFTMQLLSNIVAKITLHHAVILLKQIGHAQTLIQANRTAHTYVHL
jgi:hypothetical protein